jgi:dTDP-4-dehydrorhamnose 3,5-epimerase
MGWPIRDADTGIAGLLMRFIPLSVDGAFAVEVERREDHRGFFARTFCEEEFRRHGLDPVITQCNMSWNRARGTLRGIHFQRAPHPEAKLVRCTRGAAFDVVVDLRGHSPTQRKWASVELTADARNAIYIPAGCGHGFQTLADDTELFYQMSESWDGSLSDGIHWADPAISIAWPIMPPIISESDDALPNLRP